MCVRERERERERGNESARERYIPVSKCEPRHMLFSTLSLDNLTHFSGTHIFYKKKIIDPKNIFSKPSFYVQREKGSQGANSYNGQIDRQSNVGKAHPL